MSRPGNFFDQDSDSDPESAPEEGGPPTRAPRGVLYDQDGEPPPARPPGERNLQMRREILRQKTVQERQELERRDEYRRTEQLRRQVSERRKDELERRSEDQRRVQADRHKEMEGSRQHQRERGVQPGHLAPPSPPGESSVTSRQTAADRQSPADRRRLADRQSPADRYPAPTERPVAREPDGAAPPRLLIGSNPVAPNPDLLRISSRPVTPDTGARKGGSGISKPTEAAPRRERAEPLQRAPAQQRQRAPSRQPARPPAGQSTGQATAVLAVGTFASRLTGFVRVLVIGYVLGISNLSDAFNYANGIPNIIYDLLVGGILSATLVPVFVDQLGGEDRRERARALSAIMTAIAGALVGASLLLWLMAPWVIRFYMILSPSSSADAAERGLATHLLRYFAPQVFFLGITVASTALLNAARRFTAAAISPVLNNLVAIAALLATKEIAAKVLATGSIDAFARDSRAIMVLGIGTTAGYAIQLLVQLPAMRRLGLHLRPVWDLRHPAVRQVAGLSSWLVGVVLANQAALALVTILAGANRGHGQNGTGGGWTAYQFGYQFFQLPYALIAVSVASAIMPNLAGRWSARDRVGFERQLIGGLRVTLSVIIPVALVYMTVTGPFIEIAVHHGRVHQSSAHLISETLVYFTAGLPGFSAFFLLMRAYQAMQDSRGMFRVYVLENGLTIVLAPLFFEILGVPGLALAWVGPYTLASIYAVIRLRPRVGSLGGWFTVRALIRICIASAFTGAAAVAVGLPFPSHGGDVVLAGRIVVQAAVGLGVYLFLAHELHIREVRSVTAAAKRLLGR